MDLTQRDPSQEQDLSLVATAIVRAIAYADVFDYPLSAKEIQRYLVGVPASLATVESVLNDGRALLQPVTRGDGYYALPGREWLMERRLGRAKTAHRMWSTARRYGLAIACLPFVRMVAVTGTLAVDNVDVGADIDYMIVTTSDRLWLARSLAILCVYVARLEGVEVCPNYVLTMDRLEQSDRSLFTAHELAQMKPLYGLDIYRELIRANDWVYRYLPNAFGAREDESQLRIPHALRKLKHGAERVLDGRLGTIWEKRERTIKIHRLSEAAGIEPTRAAAYTPQRCKGHVDDHGSWIVQAYVERLERLGLGADLDHYEM
jgi:hypothetical protein